MSRMASAPLQQAQQNMQRNVLLLHPLLFVQLHEEMDYPISFYHKREKGCSMPGLNYLSLAPEMHGLKQALNLDSKSALSFIAGTYNSNILL
eukprot:1147751-Pelagomonas_calceolata.AAC.2